MMSNPIDQPFESVWQWTVHFSEPVDEPFIERGAGGWCSGTEDEDLPRVLGHIEEAAMVGLLRRLTERQVPLDPRFAELAGTSELPTRSELARAVAALLGVPAPESTASEDLLVDVVLLAHGWYHNRDAPTEDTHAGHSIGSQVMERVDADDLAAAMNELGLEDEFALWQLATQLLEQMGVPIW